MLIIYWRVGFLFSSEDVFEGHFSGKKIKNKLTVKLFSSFSLPYEKRNAKNPD